MCFDSRPRRISARAPFSICCFLAAICCFAQAQPIAADDWPQWLGPERDGVWRERGILGRMPDNGPEVLWRAPVGGGYCGPAVADGRLILTDRLAGPKLQRERGDRSTPQLPGQERVLCLDVRTGKPLWEHVYECPYQIEYPAGPRATPVLEGGHVFTLGAMGDLRCLETASGRLVWRVNFVTNFQASVPVWGWAGHPLLDGNRLVCLVGGADAGVVAFDKNTGRELWRALSMKEPGYAPPMLYTVAGKRQLIIWHPDGLAALDPVSGQVLWSHAYPINSKPRRPEVTIATPRFDGRHLFLSHYYHGAVLLDLTASPGSPKVLWNRHGKAGVNFDDGLHTVMSTPVLQAGFIYGVCGLGELRCLDAATGERKWETAALFGGKPAPLGNAFTVEQAGRHWIWTDQGELILTQLAATGFQELSRAKLLEPQENTRGRDILWCHPAFANRCAYVHNGAELICVSLAAPDLG